MSAPARRLRLAAALGLVGGALGATVGIVQALFGRHIPDWSGAKSNPVGLGLLTVVLSVVAILSAYSLQGRPQASTGRRAAAFAGLLVPAALCFSTVGRLWYLPGVALFAAAGAVLAAGSGRELARVIGGHWLQVLISVLGGFELLMAVSAAPIGTVVGGVLAGLLLVAAPWAPGGARVRLALIVLATIPFAVLTWWSLVTPLIAICAVAIGLAGLRHGVRAVRSSADLRIPQPTAE